MALSTGQITPDHFSPHRAPTCQDHLAQMFHSPSADDKIVDRKIQAGHPSHLSWCSLISLKRLALVQTSFRKEYYPLRFSVQRQHCIMGRKLGWKC